MSNSLVRWVLLGHGPLGLGLLKGLLECPNGQGLGAIYWQRESATVSDPIQQSWETRTQECQVKALPFKRANTYGFVEWLTLNKPDVVFLGTWGEILMPHLLDLPGTIFINCHPSSLPKHRGPNPYSAAIFSGAAQTGVSFHVVTPSIDAGPLLKQDVVPILPDDTGESLRQRCAETAQGAAVDVIKQFQANTLLPGVVQDERQASYQSAPILTNGLINWQDPPEQVERQCRALSPWIPSYCVVGSLIHITIGALVLRQYSDLGGTVAPRRQRPGTLVPQVSSGNAQGVIVASTEPNLAFELSQIRFSILGFQCQLPQRIEQWLLKWLL